jgi:hypothetical protein
MSSKARLIQVKLSFKWMGDAPNALRAISVKVLVAS